MEEQSFELDRYIGILKRRKWHLVIPTILIMAASAAVALLWPSVYKSSATILIEEQDIPSDFVMTTVTGYAEQRIQATRQRIMSTSRLVEIINRFGLYAAYKDRWTTEEIVDKMREDIHLDLISADTIDRRTGRPAVATIAFTLSYEGRNASTVQRVAEMLVSLFLNENREVRQRQTSETTEFLKDEAQRVNVRLDAIEAQLTDFKARHVNALPEMLRVNLSALESKTSAIQRVDTQIRSLKEREAYLETQLAGIPKQEDPATARLRLLKLDLLDLKSKFSDDYPDVRKLNDEIAELERRVAKKESNSAAADEQPDNAAYITLAAQLSSTRNELKSFLQQKAELTKEIAMYRQRVESTPKIEQAYRSLLIDRDSTRAKYEDLLRKEMEARVALGLEKEQRGERFTLIDPARLPEKPYKPNRLAIMLIGVVLGAGAGVAVAAFSEFADQSIRTAFDLTKISTLPILVSIPTIITPWERRRRRWRYLSWSGAGLLLVAVGIVAFHTLVMDLDVFWAKLLRKMPPM